MIQTPKKLLCHCGAMMVWHQMALSVSFSDQQYFRGSLGYLRSASHS